MHSVFAGISWRRIDRAGVLGIRLPHDSRKECCDNKVGRAAGSWLYFLARSAVLACTKLNA